MKKTQFDILVRSPENRAVCLATFTVGQGFTEFASSTHDSMDDFPFQVRTMCYQMLRLGQLTAKVGRYEIHRIGV